MATLAAALGAQDSVMTLSASIPLYSFPAQYVIESEQIEITGGSHPSWSIERGCNGTAKAAHAAGTTVAAGWGGSGGGGPLSVIGPFVMAFDTPNFVDPNDGLGPKLADIADGALVLSWAVTRATEVFNQPGNVVLALGKVTDSGPALLAQYDATTSNGGGGVGDNSAEPSHYHTNTALSPDDHPKWGRAEAATELHAGYFSDASAPTAGQTTIYALIVTP